MSVYFLPANILTAFNLTQVVGSKVLSLEKFLAALTSAVESYDASEDQVVGQHHVKLPESAWPTVSAGVGRKSDRPEDYIVRMHCGQPTMFLRRGLAADVEGLACVVYTREAYLADPDVRNDPKEVEHVQTSDCTHVIVAVLAFAGPKAPLTPYRLVHNLAGGNNEADAWTTDDVRAKAAESIAYWNEWAVVAD